MFLDYPDLGPERLGKKGGKNIVTWMHENKYGDLIGNMQSALLPLYSHCSNVQHLAAQAARR